MNLDGLPGHNPDRREAILGGCGENVLFSTLRLMTRESVLFIAGNACVERWFARPGDQPLSLRSTRNRRSDRECDVISVTRYSKFAGTS